MTWTNDDVEAVAQATMNDRIAPLDVMARLGPNPPDDYIHALGLRVRELAVAQCKREGDLEIRQGVSEMDEPT